MKFTLPRPPSVNRMYRISKNGGMYMDKKASDWFDACHWYILQQKPGQVLPIYDKYKIQLTLGYCGRMDIDNCLKASLDLIAKHERIITDDELITELVITKLKVPHRKDEYLTLQIGPTYV